MTMIENKLSTYHRTAAQLDVRRLMEAAQVLWEEVMNQQGWMDREGKPGRPGLEALRENIGAAALRYECCELAPYLLRAHDLFEDLIQNELGLCYDWEFVPMFVQHCVSDELTMLPDWEVRLIQPLMDELIALRERRSRAVR